MPWLTQRIEVEFAKLLCTVGLTRYGSIFWERIAERTKERYAEQHGARRVSIKKARRIIETRDLATVNDSWHHSWDIARFFDEMYIYEHRAHVYVFHTKPLNPWSPAPLFTNDKALDTLIAQVDCPFWLLKLTDFDGFLARRSALSSNPKKHFPTRQTYQRHADKLACRIERMPLIGHEAFFTRNYDHWKVPKHNHSAEQVLGNQAKFNKLIPRGWFFIYALNETASNICKGVCLTAVPRAW